MKRITDLVKKYISGRAVGRVSLYVASALINSTFALLILPFILRKMNSEEYGKAIFFSLIVSVAQPLITMCLSSYFWIEFYKSAYQRLRELYSSIFLFNISVFLLFSLFLLTFNINILLPIDLGKYILLIPLIICTVSLQEDLKNYLIFKQKATAYFWINTSLFIGEYFVFYLLLIFYKQTFEVRIYSWLIALLVTLLFFVYYFLFIEKLIVIRFYRGYLKRGFTFSYPLVIQSWSKFVLSVSDRWFLVSMLSVSVMAVYNLGYQVGAMISLPITAIMNYLSPLFYQSLAGKSIVDFERRIKQYNLFLIVLFFLLVIGTFIAKLIIPYLLPEEYVGMVGFIFASGVASLMFATCIPYNSVLSFHGRTKYIAAVSIVLLVTNLIFNYGFILLFGVWGAVISTLLSYAIFAILIMRKGRKLLKQNQFVN